MHVSAGLCALIGAACFIAGVLYGFLLQGLCGRAREGSKNDKDSTWKTEKREDNE